MDKKEALDIISEDGRELKNLPDQLKKDKEVVLKAVKTNGLALQYADDSLKKDKKFILEAVKQDGRVLDFADESLKKDKEFILELIKENENVLEYADESLKNDPDVLARVDPSVKEYLAILKDEKNRIGEKLYAVSPLKNKIIEYVKIILGLIVILWFFAIFFNIGSKVMKPLNIGSKKYEKIDHKKIKKLTDEIKKKSNN